MLPIESVCPRKTSDPVASSVCPVLVAVSLSGRIPNSQTLAVWSSEQDAILVLDGLNFN